jgi:Flp pilus assembly pilin Flp
MKRNRFLKATSVLEYAMLVAIVVAALVGMQVYVKRAISARWVEAADTFGYGRQYDAP